MRYTAPLLLLPLGLGLGGCTRGTFSTEVVMRDGVQLATDVYLPRGDGPFPTVVTRTPYGRGDHMLLVDGLRAAGVALVAQDMRGRFDSEGVDQVFTTDGDGELKDGYDTLEWVVDQTWCSGAVGTLGDSAEGIVQYMQASADPPGLAVMFAGVATPNLYSDAVFQGGVPREALLHIWLEEQGSLHFLDEVAAHPYEDAFWAPVQTHDQASSVHAAGFHLGGWFDIFQAGTIDAFLVYQDHGGEGAAGAQKLVIGPWTHGGGWDQQQGELTFPESATTLPSGNVFDVLFNHHLGLEHPDITGHPDDIPAVQYYVMGDTEDPDAPGNEWRAAETWPPPASARRLYLQADGGLAEQCPTGGEDSVTDYVYDPADPAGTVCGHNLNLVAGPCDQRAVEDRPDVVVFDSGPLAAPLEITGPLSAHLFVDIDQPDTDLIVKVTDVYPDGRSMLMAEGALRLATRGRTDGLTPLQSGEVIEAVVDLWDLSLIINTGHRLRLSVTSSNTPRFAASQNNGLPYPRSVEEPGEPVTVRLHHSADHPSYLVAPDPTSPDAAPLRCQEEEE